MRPKNILMWLFAASWQAKLRALSVASGAVLLFMAFIFRTVPEPPPPEATVLSLECSVRAIAYSPDGKWLATAGGQLEPVGELKIWDPRQGTLMSSLTGHQHSVRGLAFSPRGKLLATISYDRTLRLWNVAGSPREEHVCRFESDPAALVFSRDGRRIAVSSDDRRIRLFDTQTGRLQLQFDCLCPCFTCMAFSPDDRKLATWSLGQPSIDVWDTSTGSHQEKLHRPAEEPIEPKGFESWLLTWPSKGPTLFTALSGEIDIWEAATGKVRRLAQPDTSWLGAMALSSNGQILAVGDSQGMIHFWDIETRSRLNAIVGQEDAVTSLALSADGSQVACGGHGRTVVLRNLTPTRGLAEPLNR
jgi:WD40 repeat protein